MSKEITRRQFIIGSGLTLFGVALVACEPTMAPFLPTKTPQRPLASPEIPTLKPSETPTNIPKPPEVTATPKPTENILHYPRTELSEVYLQEGLGSIGGAEGPIKLNGYEFTNLDGLLMYANEAYDLKGSEEAMTFQSIGQDPWEVLKVFVAATGGSGIDGWVVSPNEFKDQNDKYMLEKLRDWNLYRKMLGLVRGGEFYQMPFDQVLPEEMTIYKGTGLVVIGEMPDNKVLVAFTEGFDRKKSVDETVSRDVPRIWYAAIPKTIPAFPEKDMELISLEILLKEIGVEYVSGINGGEIHYQREGLPKEVWPIAKIEAKFAERIKREIGIAWVDQIDGHYCPNPVVPYLPEEQSKGLSSLAMQKNEDGIWQYKGVRGNLPVTFLAKYNTETDQWFWEETKREVVTENVNVGETFNGNPINMEILSQYKDSKDPLVWIIGGIHPEEITGWSGYLTLISQWLKDHPEEWKGLRFALGDFNPDGYERYNPNGVNIMRNADAFWLEPEVETRCSANGAYPESEPETRAIMNAGRILKEMGKLLFMVDLHRFGPVVDPSHCEGGVGDLSCLISQTLAENLNVPYEEKYSGYNGSCSEGEENLRGQPDDALSIKLEIPGCTLEFPNEDMEIVVDWFCRGLIKTMQAQIPQNIS